MHSNTFVPKHTRAILTITSVIAFLIFGLAIPMAKAQVYTFDRINHTLMFGSRGDDVRSLQEFLSKDILVYPAGLVTGYFGPLTRDAVTQFQLGYNISPVGQVGPTTLKKINALISAGTRVDVTAPRLLMLTLTILPQKATFTSTSDEPVKVSIFFDTKSLTVVETSQAKIEPYVSGNVLTDVSLSAGKQMTLDNLLPHTTYYYRIQVTDEADNVTITDERTFTTS